MKFVIEATLEWFYSALNLDAELSSKYFIFQMSVSFFVILFGVLGVVTNRNNLLLVLLSLELMTLGFVLGYSTFSTLLADFRGVVFSVLLLGLVAGESCIALAIFIHYYRISGKHTLEISPKQSSVRFQ